MPGVNRQSLREEFGALQERFGQLSGDGKVGAESRAPIESLLMLMGVLMAVFMERNTPKTNANSSKPSSRTEKDERAVSHVGTHTQGKAFDPSRPANTRTVETVAVSKISAGEACGEDLRDVRPRGHERRTRIDIVFGKVVSHVDAGIKSCPHCGSETRAPFPETFSGPLQYGSGIKAYALNLLMAQRISLKRVQHSIRSPDRPSDLPGRSCTTAGPPTSPMRIAATGSVVRTSCASRPSSSRRTATPGRAT